MNFNSLLNIVTSAICAIIVAAIIVPLHLIFRPIAKYNSGYRNYTFRSIDTILAWALARTITLLPNYLSLLKKLEIGVFFFCWRCCRESSDSELHELLKKQAISEYDHAQIFSQLTGGKLQMTGMGLMSREEKQAFKWSNVSWDSSGESYQADGISTGYLSAKIFFGFQTANSYDWSDRLAFMYVLEEFQSQFYQQLLQFVPLEVQSKLIAITEDEQNHAINLLTVLESMSQDRQKLILKWNTRKYLALLLVPFDALWLTIKFVFTGKIL